MKNMKKFLSLVLALVLALAMAVPVMAAGEGKITVDNATAGQKYKIYKIFDLTYSSTGEGEDLKEHFAYTVNKNWAGFFTKGQDGLKYVGIKNGYVYWKEEAKVEDFIKDALAYAKDETHLIAADKEQLAPSSLDGKSPVTVVFKDVDYGYYLLESTVGAVLSVNTAKPNAEIKDKNKQPTLVKEVQEDSLSNGETSWGKKNDAGIDETVNYRVTITAQKGALNYVMHDRMSDGLTFVPNSVKVSKGGTLVEPGAQTYTVKTTEFKDNCDFEVVFAKEFCDSLIDEDELVITYSAKVNEGAIIAGEGNPNDSYLQYGQDSNITTEESRTKTYVWELDVEKYAKEGEETIYLAGATFTLSPDEEGENPLTFVDKGNNVYRLATAKEIAEKNVKLTTDITTDNTGKFHIEGLDEGTYYLNETKAPDGYNKLVGPITVTISATDYEDEDISTNLKGTVGYTMSEEGAPAQTPGNGTIQVLNQTGTELPSTGGIGTTIFYVIGGILVIGAAILLISRRRMNSGE